MIKVVIDPVKENYLHLLLLLWSWFCCFYAMCFL